MTRKDYELIAKALRAARPQPHSLTYAAPMTLQWKDTVERISDALASDNPRFDPYRFEEACNGA